MITPKQVRELLEAATPAAWEIFHGSAHPNELEPGCRCLSCRISATMWHTNNALCCDDQPDNGCQTPNCNHEGYSWQDVKLIAAAPEIAQAYLELVEILEKMGVRWTEAAESTAS